MMASTPQPVGPHDERGYTLIELLIAMVMSTVILLAAFSFLQLATGDVSRITARVRANQTARTVFERMILELHSACVTPSVAPVQASSNENAIKFVSEAGTASTLSNVHLHEIIFTPPSGKSEGTLVEKVYNRVMPPAGGAAPKYTFSTESTTTQLLTGVKQMEGGVPVFQYFRFYKTGDAIPTGYKTLPYGELNPNAMSNAALETESAYVAKVTVSLLILPEGKEATANVNDRPVPLEDSVVFRLAPSSESSNNPNLPCSPQT